MIKSRPNMFLRFAEKPCHMHRLQQRFLQEGVVVAPQARLSCAAGATWAVKNQWSRKAIVFNVKFIAACTLARSTYHPSAGVHSELRLKRHQNQAKNSRKTVENRWKIAPLRRWLAVFPVVGWQRSDSAGALRRRLTAVEDLSTQNSSFLIQISSF